MKNIIKSITMLVIMTLSVTSCDDIIDSADLTATFNDGENFASFSVLAQPLPSLATGGEFVFPINLELQGPTMHLMTDDITVTIDVVSGAGTTAVEGVNYTFGSKTVTLTKAQNYIANVPVTVLTQGITPPLQESLEMSITATTGSGGTFGSIHNTHITIVYQCFADMTGTYLVTNDFCNPSKLTTIFKNADGSWHLGSADGYFLDQCTSNTGLLNGGNIVELCGEILATGNLDYGTGGGFGIGDIITGTWDGEAGILTLVNRDVSFFNVGDWNSTYVRQ